jgi:hypothetical protein
MPVCLVNACAAFLTAYVSAGPELPIKAVSVVAWLLRDEPSAVPAVRASAATMMITSTALERAMRGFRCGFTTSSSFELSRTASESVVALADRLETQSLVL